MHGAHCALALPEHRETSEPATRTRLICHALPGSCRPHCPTFASSKAPPRRTSTGAGPSRPGRRRPQFQASPGRDHEIARSRKGS
eukprot:5297387-Pyramimonas_sp.AAC.1